MKFKKSNLEHTKCAPSKNFSDGTCFTLDALKKIGQTYNDKIGKYNNTNIPIVDNKKILLKEISQRIKHCGNDQLCWFKEEWFKNLKNDVEIYHNTFRPKGPLERYKWFNTHNINNILSQYEYKYLDFEYLGAVPIDFESLPVLGIANINFDKLVKNGKTKIGMVINLDEHWQTGSHWVALFANLVKNQIYYFDSYGIRPPPRIINFIKKIALWCYNRNIVQNEYNINYDTESKFLTKYKNKYEKILDIQYNKTRHQYENSECGVYSVNFILRLLEDEDINKFKKPTSDKVINKCREVYFRFD